jgi:hypothetical protein
MAAGRWPAGLSSPRMRRSALFWLVVAIAPACTEPQTADLELVLDADECTDTELAEVAVVSIEVLGGGGEAMCTLGKRCVLDIDLDDPTPENPVSLEDIETAIAAVPQPLIDVEYDGARWVQIIGRRQEDGCFAEANHPACGLADVADASDGKLALSLRCGACDSFLEYPLCP